MRTRSIKQDLPCDLASVSVRAGVRHAELAGLGVAELEVLIGKFVSVDGFTASAIALGEISTLASPVSQRAQLKARTEVLRTWSIKS